MSSTFGSYDIARSGIFASERSLTVTGHNIANVNTDGYSRQQAMLEETKPLNYAYGQVGLGVSVQQTRQIRDNFLSTMYREENNSLGYWNTQDQAIEQIQGILGEPDDTGLSNVMEQFFNGWQELAKDPDSLTARALVRQRGIVLVDTLNSVGKQLDTMQTDTNKQIGITVNDINNTTKQIAELNQKIVVAESTGDDANDYRDQRNSLLNKLSGIININVQEQQNGSVSVVLDGVYLVNGANTEKMKVDYEDQNHAFVDVRWEKTNEPVTLTGGSLKGMIDIRGDSSIVDGSETLAESGDTQNAVEYDAANGDYGLASDSKNIIPQLKKALNTLVSILARGLNAIHEKGVGYDDSTGNAFFTRIDDSKPFAMGNIQINPDLTDVGLVAASATGQKGDSSIAQEIVAFKDNLLFKSENLTLDVDDFYNSIVTWVATVGNEANSMTSNQSTLVTQIQNKQDSISAVSMDQELTNMMKYQHAYNASARVLNYIDGMIDTIINKMKS